MSLRKAINEHCKDCIYDSKSALGTWRKQVEDCPCTQCPLYKVRPISGPKRLQTKRQTAESYLTEAT